MALPDWTRTLSMRMAYRWPIWLIGRVTYLRAPGILFSMDSPVWIHGRPDVRPHSIQGIRHALKRIPSLVLTGCIPQRPQVKHFTISTRHDLLNPIREGWVARIAVGRFQQDFIWMHIDIINRHRLTLRSSTWGFSGTRGGGIARRGASGTPCSLFTKKVCVFQQPSTANQNQYTAPSKNVRVATGHTESPWSPHSTFIIIW